MHEIKNVSFSSSQMLEALPAFSLKQLIAFAVWATHRSNHLLTDSDLRSKLTLATRLFSKNESKINMEEFAIVINHEVLQVSITDT